MIAHFLRTPSNHCNLCAAARTAVFECARTKVHCHEGMWSDIARVEYPDRTLTSSCVQAAKLTPSLSTFDTMATPQHVLPPVAEERVDVHLLEGAVSISEAMAAWPEVHAARKREETAAAPLLQQWVASDARLRRLPAAALQARLPPHLAAPAYCCTARGDRVHAGMQVAHRGIALLYAAGNAAPAGAAAKATTARRIAEVLFTCGLIHLDAYTTALSQRLAACAADMRELLSAVAPDGTPAATAVLRAAALRRLGKCDLELGAPAAAVESLSLIHI